MTVTEHLTIEALRVALTELRAGLPSTVNALADAAAALVKEFDEQAHVEWRMALGNGARVPYSSREQTKKGIETWGKTCGGHVESRIVWETEWRPT